MRKNTRKNLKAQQQAAADMAAALTPAEQAATKKVMEEALRRVARQFKGKRVSKDALDEAMATAIADVITEHEAAEKKVLMAKARATVDQPVLETVGGDDFEEEPIAVSQEPVQEEPTMKQQPPEVTLVADADGFFWPTPAYVKGETSVSPDTRLGDAVVAHQTEEAAAEASAAKTLDALLNKLRPTRKPADSTESTTPSDTTNESTDSLKEDTVNTNDSNANNGNDSTNTAADGAQTTSFWSKLKDKLAAIGEQASDFLSEAALSGQRRWLCHMSEGRKTRGILTLIGTFVATWFFWGAVFSAAITLLSGLGTLGLVLYIALVIGVVVFAAVPVAYLVYNLIDRIVDAATGLFTKKPAADDGFATA